MLVVDIGNTSINWGVEREGELIKIFKTPTSQINSKKISEITESFPCKEIIVCSVVPRINLLFKKLKKNVFFVGKDLKIPISCLYNRRQVGEDRLVAAFSARIKSPSARIVIDFGTAITFDFLSKKGEYLGGIILPGITLSYRTLSLNCALLPKEIKMTRLPFIPKNTFQSINKGIVEGLSLIINSWVKKYRKKFQLKDKKENVIVTGSDTGSIFKKLDFSFLYFPHLVLEGLVLLGRKIKE
ncbi:MAG: hypothetical protein B6D55_01720 [Candidatus Omnitrophica bacterium 4484_70.2]|nr:MAG: hypothetical protein B6D55_01720 [Candidatus Omnitrophica bacterium 4484_70.2]